MGAEIICRQVFSITMNSHKKIIKYQEKQTANEMNDYSSCKDEKLMKREMYEAAEKANMIIEAAKKKSKEIIVEEQKKAYEAGYHEGMSQAVGFIVKAQSYYEQVLKENEKKLVELALRIAEKIIGESIKLEPEMVMNIVQRCMLRYKMQNNIIVKINPEDQKICESLECTRSIVESSGGSVVFESDETIQRGGILIESESGIIDARIDTQLNRIHEAFTLSKNMSN